MAQGAKKPSSPVSINQLSGTFKKGGKVTPAEGRLMKNFAAENKTAMKQAKAQSNEVYSKYQKMQKGGSPTPNESFFDKNKVDPKSASDKASRELEDAMNPLSMAKELFGKARDAFRGQESKRDVESGSEMMPYRMPKKFDSTNELDIDSTRNRKPARIDPDESSDFSAMPMRRGQGAVTKTEKSITVSPAGKKRGGRAC
jgi:hypothetical protein